MVFSSITFLFYFLPIVLAAYFLAPKKAKNLVLLVASLFFYAWGEPTYVLLMLLSICGNYFCGKFLQEAREQKSSRYKVKGLFAGIVAWNIAVLFLFKYINLLISGLNLFPGVEFHFWKISLPIGISFYTFQILSYVIDVYRGEVEAQQNFISFALYVTMFPQLIAGPIVKYKDIEKELAEREITLVRFGMGAERFIAGLAKKVLLANNLGAIFTQISSMPSGERSILLVWLGAVSYSLQLYFDFSGYSDMAIGLGQMFGFHFPENFRYPYISRTITEFWRRWHISLSTWFREYVYIPLGGNRVAVWKHIRNILIVWAFTGLWHGASLNFFLWGMIFALFLILEKYLFGKVFDRHPMAGHVYTLLVVVINFTIFAIPNMGELKVYLSQMFFAGGIPLANGTFGYILGVSWIILVLGCLFSTPLMYGLKQKVIGRMPSLASFINVILLGTSIAYLVYQSYNPFLYFRF